jgi:hypothetical protein
MVGSCRSVSSWDEKLEVEDRFTGSRGDLTGTCWKAQKNDNNPWRGRGEQDDPEAARLGNGVDRVGRISDGDWCPSAGA